MRHAICLSLLLIAALDANAFTWPEKTVDSMHPEASGIALYDLDDDDDLDIVAGDKIGQDGFLAWYENLPQPMGQVSWNRHTIGARGGAREVAVGDIDRDGVPDVAAAFSPYDQPVDDALRWYRGGVAEPWPETLIKSVPGAKPTGIFLADLDGDDDLDVLASWMNLATVAWYENPWPFGGPWSEHLVDAGGLAGVRAVIAADLDGDADLDVVAAGRDAGQLVWYEHVPDVEPSWNRYTVALLPGVVSVVAEDLDGDGQLDLVATGRFANSVRWYANRLPFIWQEYVIDADMPEACALAVGEIDLRDGPDVVASSKTGEYLAWYRAPENPAEPLATWQKQKLDPHQTFAQGVALGDIDGDGDPDVAGTSRGDGLVTWHRNQYGIPRYVCVDGTHGHLEATGSCEVDVSEMWQDPFLNVREALLQAENGDHVWVAEGYYLLIGGSALAEGTNLLGGFAGNEPPVAASESLRDPGGRPCRLFAGELPSGVVLVLSSETLVDGFRAFSWPGPVLRAKCEAGDDPVIVTISNNEIWRGDAGIDLVFASGEPGAEVCHLEARVVGNRFHDNETGLRARIETGFAGPAGLEATVERNTFFANSAAAVELPQEPGLTLLDLDLAGNLVVYNHDGIVVKACHPEAMHNSVAVNNNILEKNETAGWQSWLCADVVNQARFASNTLRRNGTGLFLETEVLGDLQIVSNWIVRQDSHGIACTSWDVPYPMTFHYNWIQNGDAAGLWMGGNLFPDLTMTRNKLAFNDEGLVVETLGAAPGAYVIGGDPDERNDLAGNRDYGMANRTDWQMTAEWNYWGYDSAPQIDEYIDGEVDFEPWYSTADVGEPQHVEAYPLVSSGPGAFPHDRPAQDSEIAVKWTVDTANSGSPIASFEGSLRWDPWVLQFTGWQTGSAGFSVQCDTSRTDRGVLSCSGSHTGASGQLELVCTGLEVIGPVAWVSPLDLEFESLHEPMSAQNLVEILVAHDEYVRVAPLAVTGDVLSDDQVDAGDALVILSREVELPIPPECDERIEDRLGDCNGDGETDSGDANVMLSHEIGLPVPPHVNQPNLYEDVCAHRAVIDPASAEVLPQGDVIGFLTFAPSDQGFAGSIDVGVWLNNRTDTRIGSYTAELSWDADGYRLEDWQVGSMQALSGVQVNDGLQGRLPFTVADPQGAGPGPVRLLVARLAPLAWDTSPARDVSVEFSALGGISPRFPSLLDNLRIETLIGARRGMSRWSWQAPIAPRKRGTRTGADTDSVR